jgi:hypothetical protein
MSSTAPSAEHAARHDYVDWEDVSGLDKIVAVYEVGDRSIVVETRDNREIRITAWRDLGTGRYVADYERRSVVKSGNKEVRVWAQTRAYQQCTGDDVASCLEAAVFAVDRTNVF